MANGFLVRETPRNAFFERKGPGMATPRTVLSVSFRIHLAIIRHRTLGLSIAEYTQNTHRIQRNTPEYTEHTAQSTERVHKENTILLQ